MMGRMLIDFGLLSHPKNEVDWTIVSSISPATKLIGRFPSHLVSDVSSTSITWLSSHFFSLGVG
jgi:hypothetical protein